MSQPAGSSGPGTWVEKGQGSLKLMKSPLTERTRMVMVKERPTNDGRMDILLNQVVHWESTLVPAQSDDGSSNRAYVFEAEDYAVCEWPGKAGRCWRERVWGKTHTLPCSRASSHTFLFYPTPHTLQHP